MPSILAHLGLGWPHTMAKAATAHDRESLFVNLHMFIATLVTKLAFVLLKHSARVLLSLCMLLATVVPKLALPEKIHLAGILLSLCMLGPLVSYP